MGGLSIPEISCIICSEPMDISVDLSADENGKAVHEECYVSRLLRACRTAAIEELFNTLKTMQPPNLNCPQCGLALSRMPATFFLANGKAWEIPLPVCTYCNPAETVAGPPMEA